MKLYYYEVITKASSAGFFSGYMLETNYGFFDYWNEDSSALIYKSKNEFLKDMEAKEGAENFKMVQV